MKFWKRNSINTINQHALNDDFHILIILYIFYIIRQEHGKILLLVGTLAIWLAGTAGTRNLIGWELVQKLPFHWFPGMSLFSVLSYYSVSSCISSCFYCAPPLCLPLCHAFLLLRQLLYLKLSLLCTLFHYIVWIHIWFSYFTNLTLCLTHFQHIIQSLTHTNWRKTTCTFHSKSDKTNIGHPWLYFL